MSLTKDVAWAAQKSSNGDFSSFMCFFPFPDSLSFNEFRFKCGNRVLSLERVAKLVQGYDLVIDCTDAPPSRYLLNDAALHAARPLIAASAVG